MKYRFIRILNSVEDVIKALKTKISIKPHVLKVNVVKSVGYFAAENIYASFDYPPYHRSAVDGFAVRAEDVSSASQFNPAVLKLIGFMHTNDTPEKYIVKKGECVEVTTGAPLPLGANAIVMAEYAKKLSNSEVEIMKPVAPWDNVSLKGEDVRKGQLIVRKGEVIKPWHVGLLATLNIVEIKVFDRLKASVLGVGDELIPLGSKIEPGKIVSSTMYLVKAFLSELGVNVVYTEIVPDEVEVISLKVREALSKSDVVFTTGGTSVGLRDFTVEAVKKLNPDFFLHGVAIKPGKPMAVATVKGKPVFMLSGYPVATFTELIAVFEPIYYSIYGSKIPPKPTIKGRLVRRVYVEPGIRGYVRVKVFKKNNEVLIEPLMVTGSGILSTLIEGNGLLIVPENVEGYDEGDEVEVILTNPIGE